MKTAIEKVYDALEKHCDMSRYWNHPEFHCFEQFPRIVWIWPVTQAIESQLSNGGLGQLLWNTFSNWRALLDKAEEAYGWLELPDQTLAIREFRAIFERFESVCQFHFDQYRRTNDFSEFGKWMTFANANIRSSNVDLFCEDKELETRKDLVLREHFKEILSEIKVNGSKRPRSL